MRGIRSLLTCFHFTVTSSSLNEVKDLRCTQSARDGRAMSVSCRSFTSFEDDGGYREVVRGEEARYVTSRNVTSRPLPVRRVVRI